MTIDPAISEALEATLAETAGQNEDFKKKLRTLVGLVLTANYQDADVRRVMESIHVSLGADS
jgi:endonuclease III